MLSFACWGKMPLSRCFRLPVVRFITEGDRTLRVYVFFYGPTRILLSSGGDSFLNILYLPIFVDCCIPLRPGPRRGGFVDIINSLQIIHTNTQTSEIGQLMEIFTICQHDWSIHAVEYSNIPYIV